MAEREEGKLSGRRKLSLSVRYQPSIWNVVLQVNDKSLWLIDAPCAVFKHKTLSGMKKKKEAYFR